MSHKLTHMEFLELIFQDELAVRADRMAGDSHLTLQRLGEPDMELPYECADRNFAGDCCYFTQRYFVDRMLDRQPFETSGEVFEDALTCTHELYGKRRVRKMLTHAPVCTAPRPVAHARTDPGAEVFQRKTAEGWLTK
jgi:hypothetical protein